MAVHVRRMPKAGPDPATDNPTEASLTRLKQIQREFGTYCAALNQCAIVSHTDRHGNITAVNAEFCRLTGYSVKELMGRPHSIIKSGVHPETFYRDIWRTISSGGRWRGEICNRAKDGSFHWVDTTIVGVVNERDEIDSYIAIRFDITDRKRAEVSLRSEVDQRRRVETLLYDVIETIPSGITAFDDKDQLVLFNSAYKDCYPAAADVIHCGASFGDLVDQIVDRYSTLFGDQEEEKRQWTIDRLSRHHSPGHPQVQQIGSDRWLKVQERRSPNGYTVGIYTDVSELKRAELQLRVLSETDPLTGVANRRRALCEIERVLQADSPGVLIIVDLDHFKSVNDTHGHDAGDELLRQVALRLVNTLGDDTMVARLGGDEFALLIKGPVSQAGLIRCLDKLTATLSLPFNICGSRISGSGTCGVACFGADADKPLELLKHADMALYHAKRNNRGNFAIFQEEMRRDQETKGKMTDALRHALSSNDIAVALQPIFDASTGRHYGFEALARWQLDGVPIPPAQFIGLAEGAGLTRLLDQQVIVRALQAYRDLKRLALEPGVLSINVAAASLHHPSFAESLLRTLAQYELAPQMLSVEVTETVILDEQAETIKRGLQCLADAGVSIALDDFGTGYASLAHLKRLPVNCLKIDRSFVAALGNGNCEATIAKLVVSLARELRLRVIAEGVETEEQSKAIISMGCHLLQGFLIARPMHPGDVEQYLRAPAPRIR